jgi:hypothetical protein
MFSLALEQGSEVMFLVVFSLKTLTIVDVDCVLVDYACKVRKGKETESKVRSASTQVDCITSIWIGENGCRRSTCGSDSIIV